MEGSLPRQQRGHKIVEPAFVPFEDSLFTTQYKQPLENDRSDPPRLTDPDKPPIDVLSDYHRILEEELEDTHTETETQMCGFNPSPSQEQEATSEACHVSSGWAEVVDSPLNTRGGDTPVNTSIPTTNGTPFDAFISVSRENELLNSLPSDELLQAAFSQNEGELDHAMLLESMGIPFDNGFFGNAFDATFMD